MPTTTTDITRLRTSVRSKILREFFGFDDVLMPSFEVPALDKVISIAGASLLWLVVLIPASLGLVYAIANSWITFQDTQNLFLTIISGSLLLAVYAPVVVFVTVVARHYRELTVVEPPKPSWSQSVFACIRTYQLGRSALSLVHRKTPPSSPYARTFSGFFFRESILVMLLFIVVIVVLGIFRGGLLQSMLAWTGSRTMNILTAYLILYGSMWLLKIVWLGYRYHTILDKILAVGYFILTAWSGALVDARLAQSIRTSRLFETREFLEFGYCLLKGTRTENIIAGVSITSIILTKVLGVTIDLQKLFSDLNLPIPVSLSGITFSEIPLIIIILAVGVFIGINMMYILEKSVYRVYLKDKYV